MLPLSALLFFFAADFEVAGTLLPATPAHVALHGSTSPFGANTLADARGRFSFRDLAAGTYTLVVYVPGQGEARQTLEVGPATADAKGRVAVTFDLREHPPVPDTRREGKVSAKELAIPDKAWKAYQNAQKALTRRDVKSAIADLERALEIAPQMVAAWNNLGTIAYHSREYTKAETYFRRGLREDPNAYEPLVNLGGVLLTLGKLDEAAAFNLRAVLIRPQDALANSQLGMTYFAVGSFGLAKKYLREAKRLDAAHFSHPQITLAEIYFREANGPAALAEFEEFLRLHPDDPKAPQLRQLVERLRQAGSAR